MQHRLGEQCSDVLSAIAGKQDLILTREGGCYKRTMMSTSFFTSVSIVSLATAMRLRTWCVVL